MEELKKLEIKKELWNSGNCLFYSTDEGVINVDFSAIDRHPSLLYAEATINRNIDFIPRDTYTIGDAVRFWK